MPVMELIPQERGFIERGLQPDAISMWGHWRGLTAIKTTFFTEVKGTSGPVIAVCQNLDSDHQEGSDLTDLTAIYNNGQRDSLL